MKKYLKILYAFIYAYLHSVFYTPKRVRLDICNMCQLNCTKCWVRENEEIVKKCDGGFGYINFETFKNFIDKNKFIKEIDVVNKGEAFLNPDLNKIIKYACEKGVKLTATGGVNLNTLSEETAESLVKYQFGDIFVSIDGASPETYKIYRRNGNFDKVINNIKLINKYKELYNSENPKLTYKFIIFGHNEHEIEDAKKLAKDLNMDIYFMINSYPEYSPVKDEAMVKEITGAVTLHNCEENRFLLSLKSKWSACKDLFDFPVININGDFFGCCVPYMENFGVNVFKTGLKKALRHPNVIYAKAMLLNFDIKPKAAIPCSKCNSYKLLKTKKRNLKHVLKNYYKGLK